MTPVSIAVVGAGHRGRDAYGRYCLEHPAQARVVAVAEPDPERRGLFARRHRVESVFDSGEDLLSAPRLADAVVIATPDRTHTDAAIAALRKGYHVLLEKPIAPSAEEIRHIQTAAADSTGTVTIAHVLRHTPFFAAIKRQLDQGVLGDLVMIQHAENIGYWHFAHSYVRGHWRRADLSNPMLLAKACHDLDIVRWLAGSRCVQVASFGGLRHFTADNAPPNAPDRCVDGCPAAAECPFYAPRFYLQRLAGTGAWPVTVMTSDPTEEGISAALSSGPYGRCVYRCDNDVADHQAVMLSFANGVTASLTVSAFTSDNARALKLAGTKAELRARIDTGEIEIRHFLPGAGGATGGRWDRADDGRSALAGDRVTRMRIRPTSDTGHEGGDDGLMSAFLDGLRAGGLGRASTSLDESVESHLMAFAAERSRRTGDVIRL